jgi:hypothetical protein
MVTGDPYNVPGFNRPRVLEFPELLFEISGVLLYKPLIKKINPPKSRSET